MSKEKEQVVKTIKVKGIRRRIESIGGGGGTSNILKGVYNYSGVYNGVDTNWIFTNTVDVSNNIVITIEATRKDKLLRGRDILIINFNGNDRDLNIRYGSEFNGWEYNKWTTPTPKYNGSFITKEYLESRLASLKEETD